MIYHLADNIISPLGYTSQSNYDAVKCGESALRRYDGKWGLPEPFAASLFSDEQWASILIDGFTRFESLAIRSAQRAIETSGIDVAQSNVIFILSTTKGNIDLLKNDGEIPEEVYPHKAATRIANAVGITTSPIVVCNACISGVSAIILAKRLLEAKIYDYAVVCGAEIQSRFTVAGFQSLKAVSPEPCRPFDLERIGLNLGEAAATMVFAANPERGTGWKITGGAINNDAFHVSSPSKNGDGAYRALTTTLTCVNIEDLAFVNAHGTATMFNDQMESVAIMRASLGETPINALKGYFGHTLGAAGVLETIVSMYSVDDHTILGTRGYEGRGVSGAINVCGHNLPTDKECFVKMISGFGGCNAAIMVTKKDVADDTPNNVEIREPFQAIARVSPYGVRVGGYQVLYSEKGDELITKLYKEDTGNYPKFYKMDMLSRLAFVTSEELIPNDKLRDAGCDNRAIILFNNSSSIDADRKFVASIDTPEGFFPSPSVFVYTLPNMSTAEIAMRNKYYGETSFYIIDKMDYKTMQQVVKATLLDPSLDSAIYGWVDYKNSDNFLSDLHYIEKKQTNKIKEIMEDLILELKQHIIKALNLEEMTPDEIDENAPLFGEGLGLDSIDALELIVLLEKNYGIRLDNPSEGKAIFKSVATIAQYVSEHRTK